MPRAVLAIEDGAALQQWLPIFLEQALESAPRLRSGRDGPFDPAQGGERKSNREPVESAERPRRPSAPFGLAQDRPLGTREAHAQWRSNPRQAQIPDAIQLAIGHLLYLDLMTQGSQFRAGELTAAEALGLGLLKLARERLQSQYARCGRCGGLNRSTAGFCARCGEKFR